MLTAEFVKDFAERWNKVFTFPVERIFLSRWLKFTPEALNHGLIETTRWFVHHPEKDSPNVCRYCDNVIRTASVDLDALDKLMQ